MWAGLRRGVLCFCSLLHTTIFLFFAHACVWFLLRLLSYYPSHFEEKAPPPWTGWGGVCRLHMPAGWGGGEDTEPCTPHSARFLYILLSMRGFEPRSPCKVSDRWTTWMEVVDLAVSRLIKRMDCEQACNHSDRIIDTNHLQRRESHRPNPTTAMKQILTCERVGAY